ncbi:VOC family protein [Cohnella lupini]|uniref:Catechol 2,3-dioxygenase-like lactoylglutathione lyase family enzyme n=1 Tax=Cohnella lupini TaxID=1294267 RepID=A0A3D9IN98_9BACL|nr:VOC family protein [Cohnella lupini]RED63242.1 catechol 2,3-dioxygenase-like lactoylglutathione lyase family enzyme [Cohnella lupini]
MKLNHLNLTVTDVAAARDFLAKYFGLRKIESGGDKRENTFAAMFDDSGLVLTLMKGAQADYPKTFHIGFAQENEEKVNEINRRLKEDGFDVASPVRSHGWTFYVKAPGGFTVEVLC